MKEKLTVSDLVIQQLINWDVKRIYAVAGDTILEFFDKLTDYPEIELITARHESAAAFMASAEAKLTGQLTVCIGHNGPGAANLINGLGDAYTDKCPVLVITGQVERWNMGTNYKQYIHQQGLLNGVTSFSELAAHPDSVVDLLTKAMRMSQGQGTVSHLVIPKDLFTMKTDEKPRSKEPYLFTGPTQHDLIPEAAQKINYASKPVILAGRGIIFAKDQTMELAEKIGAGIVTTLPARGYIPSNHSCNLGGLGHAGSEAGTKALKESDLVIVLGATWWPHEYVPRDKSILQIDTNSKNLGSTKRIEFGLVGKLENILPILVEKVNQKNVQEWRNRIQQLKNDWEERLADEASKLTSPLQPQTIIDKVNKYIADDAIITLDVGDHVVWFNRSFKASNQNILVSGRWRSMGFGLPAACAAKLTYPDKEVILITGDGGLSMVLGELSEITRYQLPIKILVINNKSLAMEKNRMVVSQLTPNGVDLTNPDYAKVATAFGITGYSVKKAEQLDEALKKTFSTDKPVLVDIDTASTIPPHTKL